MPTPSAKMPIGLYDGQQSRWHEAMQLALAEAQIAADHGDVPVGAVVISHDGVVLSAAHNRREQTGDPTAHAEILALQKAAASTHSPHPGQSTHPGRLSSEQSERLSKPPAPPVRSIPPAPPTPSAPPEPTWRVSGCTVVVTLEPCVMCAGAIVAARAARIVFGAWDAKAGACGSVWDLVRDTKSLHQIEVIPGVQAAQSEALLKSFFQTKR
jgi:tRNA(adenine34) deaminase